MPTIKYLRKKSGLPLPSGFVDCRAGYVLPVNQLEIAMPVKMDPDSIRHASRVFYAVCQAKECPSYNLQTVIIVMLDELHRLKSQYQLP